MITAGTGGWGTEGGQDSFHLHGKSFASINSFQDVLNLEFSDLEKGEHTGKAV